VTEGIVLAVDGGNYKTDVALVDGDGDVLALVRGPLCSPQDLGVAGCLAVVEELLARACDDAGLPNGAGPVAEVGQLLIAGVDFASEEEALRQAAEEAGFARHVVVANDTFAVLRAGTDRGWGVAVVCGAGINCVGVAPDGRHARFPALGAITGDWGGGYDVGLAGLTAAARSEDGRGPKTSLERVVPAHFGFETPSALGEAIHLGHVEGKRVIELAPIVLAEAADDAVAGSIVARLADEIVALARVALERLGLSAAPVEVVLGGGLTRSADGRLIRGVQTRLEEVAPSATVVSTSSHPIVGAALLGLDELGAEDEARARVCSRLDEFVTRIEAEQEGGRHLEQSAASTGKPRSGRIRT
jgi:N-acetylglucosamine kinase-like BadF-type ATPase